MVMAPPNTSVRRIGERERLYDPRVREARPPQLAAQSAAAEPLGVSRSGVLS
jgi:hypothetical protein